MELSEKIKGSFLSGMLNGTLFSFSWGLFYGP